MLSARRLLGSSNARHALSYDHRHQHELHHTHRPRHRVTHACGFVCWRQPTETGTRHTTHLKWGRKDAGGLGRVVW